MFGFIKKFFCHCDTAEERKEKAVKQDKEVRDHISQQEYDKEVNDTMEGSDPIAKY